MLFFRRSLFIFLFVSPFQLFSANSELDFLSLDSKEQGFLRREESSSARTHGSFSEVVGKIKESFERLDLLFSEIEILSEKKEVRFCAYYEKKLLSLRLSLTATESGFSIKPLTSLWSFHGDRMTRDSFYYDIAEVWGESKPRILRRSSGEAKGVLRKLGVPEVEYVPQKTSFYLRALENPQDALVGAQGLARECDDQRYALLYRDDLYLLIQRLYKFLFLVDSLSPMNVNIILCLSDAINSIVRAVDSKSEISLTLASSEALRELKTTLDLFLGFDEVRQDLFMEEKLLDQGLWSLKNVLESSYPTQDLTAENRVREINKVVEKIKKQEERDSRDQIGFLGLGEDLFQN